MIEFQILDLRFFEDKISNYLSVSALKIDERISVIDVRAFDFADENRVISGDEILHQSAFEIDERIFQNRNSFQTFVMMNVDKFVGDFRRELVGMRRLFFA